MMTKLTKNLCAGIPQNKNRAEIAAIIATVNVPVFAPKSGKHCLTKFSRFRKKPYLCLLFLWLHIHMAIDVGLDLNNYKTSRPPLKYPGSRFFGVS